MTQTLPFTPIDKIMNVKHAKFFNRCLKVLPAGLKEFLDKRTVVAFFAVCGLDLIDNLPEDRNELIEWFYSFQYEDSENDTASFMGGFQIGEECKQSPFDVPSLGMAYTSLTSLVILGDDFSRIRRRQILKEMTRLQQKDGSFAAQWRDGEIDMRYTYCAICVCYMLNDFSTIDVDRCVSFIMSCLTYESGFACVPGAEAHGGSTFCAIASLQLLGRLDSAITEKQKANIIRWCLFRQATGFNGRPNKLVDTCYSFWVGGTLEILGAFDLTDKVANREYVLNTQSPIIGGMGKWDASSPDPLHTCFGLSGMSFIGEDDVQKIFTPLNISRRSHERLKKIHKQWGEDGGPRL